MAIERDPIIDEAAEILGGVVAMSTALGRSRGAVSQWARIPAEHVLQIERMTGISRHRQRPDIFGLAPPDQSNARQKAAA